MDRWLELGCVWLMLAACGGEHPKAAGGAIPAASPAAPPPPPPKPAVTVPAPQADNPCTRPAAQTLDLELGVARKTPWDLELTYALDEDRKLGPGFVFILHSGERRWETRRDTHTWTRALVWHGFCWRGVDHPAIRAKQVRIEVAPLCRDGVLQDSGGKCGSVFPQ